MGKWTWTGAAALAALVAVGGFIGVRGWEKAEEFRARFQLLEAKVASYGHVLAAERVRYQHKRGPANLSGGPDVFPKGKWVKIAGTGEHGSWDARRFTKTKALSSFANDLFVGLCGSGGAQIWRYDGAKWTKSWPSTKIEDECVHVLLRAGGALYAGVDDRILRFSNGSWQEIGAPGKVGYWTRGAFQRAYSMATFDGNLIVGTSRPAAAYLYRQGKWHRLTRGTAIESTRYRGIYELISHSDGALYAGMISAAGATSVFKYDGEGWTRVGGDGLNGSWRSPGATYVLSMASFRNRLIVGTNRHPVVKGAFSSIWAFDGKEWQPIGIEAVPPRWGRMHNFNALHVYRNHLVAGGGGHPAGNASAWVLGSKPWQFGGNGVRSSWGGEDGRLTASPPAPGEYVYRFTSWRGSLVAGFGLGPGTAQVWQYKPDR